MCQRRHRNHPRRPRSQQLRQQQPRKREMPQMIRPELPLKPIDRNFALRQRHHTSVIDQQIERNSAPRKCSRKAAYRRQRSHIHFHQLSSRPRCFTLQTLQRSLSLRRIPACQKHVRPIPRQLQRRLVANPAVRASHQCRLARLRGDLLDRPLRCRHCVCLQLLGTKPLCPMLLVVRPTILVN